MINKTEIIRRLNLKIQEKLETLREEYMSLYEKGKELSGCDCEDCTGEEVEEEVSLDETRWVKKVNAKGRLRRKLVCGPGRKSVNVGGKQKCVPYTSRDKIAKKKAIRKTLRTKKAKGAGYKMRVNRKRKIAMRKRRSLVGR